MKKILIAGYNLDFGGIEKSLINLLKNIDSNKYEVTLLLQEKKGAFLSEVPSFVSTEEYRISTCPLKIIRKLTNRLHLLFYTFKNKKKYDHAICYVPYDIPSSIITKIVAKKSTYWIHSNYTYIYKEKELRNFFDKRKITEFDQIVFVSNEAKEDLISYYPSIQEKSYAVNNLFDFDDILNKSKEDVSLSSSTNLVFVGRLEEKSKALLRLFEIMKEFQKEKKDYYLFVIGDGPDLKKYQNYIKKNHIKNITLKGSMKNPYPYMRKADILVLPSYYEGFPVVCIEALSLHTKVLTTIDVSTSNFTLKDYVYLCKNEKKDIKNGIIKAVNGKNKKQFDSKKFNEENKKVTFQIIDGDRNEI